MQYPVGELHRRDGQRAAVHPSVIEQRARATP